MPRGGERRTRNDSDSVLECNKATANCKRSPSFKEAEEIRDLLKSEEKSSEKSLKKDGCCQTDKKDLKKARVSPCNVKINNSDEPFEREIQKLLDEQNLLQNIPPKMEFKDLTLEPLVRLVM